MFHVCVFFSKEFVYDMCTIIKWVIVKNVWIYNWNSRERKWNGRTFYGAGLSYFIFIEGLDTIFDLIDESDYKEEFWRINGI